MPDVLRTTCQEVLGNISRISYFAGVRNGRRSKLSLDVSARKKIKKKCLKIIEVCDVLWHS